MRALVVFESMFGNTEQVAREVAAGLSESMEVEVRDVANSAAGQVPAAVELLVVGGPTHGFSMSRQSTRDDATRQGAEPGQACRGIREWLNELPPSLNGLHAASFDSRVTKVRRLPGSAARNAMKALRHHHARMIALPENFYVTDTTGPLEDRELERARDWGRELGLIATARPTEYAAG